MNAKAEKLKRFPLSLKRCIMLCQQAQQSDQFSTNCEATVPTDERPRLKEEEDRRDLNETVAEIRASGGLMAVMLHRTKIDNSR